MILKLKWLFMESIPITTVETNARLAESMIEHHINNMHHAEKSFGKKGRQSGAFHDHSNARICCVNGSKRRAFDEGGHSGNRVLSCDACGAVRRGGLHTRAVAAAHAARFGEDFGARQCCGIGRALGFVPRHIE